MEMILINGVPSLFAMSKDEKNAFFKDPQLIADILKRKQEKTKKELLPNRRKVEAIVQ